MYICIRVPGFRVPFRSKWFASMIHESRIQGLKPNKHSCWEFRKITVCEIYKETQTMTNIGRECEFYLVLNIWYVYLLLCVLFSNEFIIYCLGSKTELCIPVGLQTSLNKTMNWKPNKNDRVLIRSGLHVGLENKTMLHVSRRCRPLAGLGDGKSTRHLSLSDPVFGDGSSSSVLWVFSLTDLNCPNTEAPSDTCCTQYEAYVKHGAYLKQFCLHWVTQDHTSILWAVHVFPAHVQTKTRKLRARGWTK